MRFTLHPDCSIGSLRKRETMPSAAPPSLSSPSRWTDPRVATAVGLLLRIALAWLMPLWLDDTEVPYTDIDYHVFADAAAHVRRGDTPYRRSTYRYSPFLAALLARLQQLVERWQRQPPDGKDEGESQAGRYLFCVADAVCGWMILEYRRRDRRASVADGSAKKSGSDLATTRSNTLLETIRRSRLSDPELQDALWWLYNPLAINICTRGSAESLVVLMPVLVTTWIVSSTGDSAPTSSSWSLWGKVIVAGAFNGIAVHAKLYPVIYSLSYASYLAVRGQQQELPPKTPPGNRNSIGSRLSYLWSCIRRLLTPIPIAFAASFVASFSVLTYLSVLWYGPLALEEGLLYHFSRVDHRHNYSMHFYWIYLARGAVSIATASGDQHPIAGSMALVGRILLLPQLVILVYTSLDLAPRNLTLALFIQTFVFVALNKVITAQYFTWYLCLLPLCSEYFALTKRVRYALAALLGSVLFWLGSAYCLEMRGLAVYRVVWAASVAFFAANVNLLGALIASTPISPRSRQGRQARLTGRKTRCE